jgi:hypothetical protein
MAAQLVAAPDAKGPVLTNNRSVRGLLVGSCGAPGAQVSLVLGSPADQEIANRERLCYTWYSLESD